MSRTMTSQENDINAVPKSSRVLRLTKIRIDCEGVSSIELSKRIEASAGDDGDGCGLCGHVGKGTSKNQSSENSGQMVGAEGTGQEIVHRDDATVIPDF